MIATTGGTDFRVPECHPAPTDTPRSHFPDADPRRLRSRAKLLAAATGLLERGGIEAVTIDAVTRVSKVARTTLYRNFGSIVALRAAALDRFLLPAAQVPDSGGTLRDRLIELVHRQAVLIDRAPLHMTTLTWTATSDPAGTASGPEAVALRQHLIERYRRPFDELLGDAHGGAPLDERESITTVARLVGPIVFLRLTGLGRTTRADCARIVDDFLVTRNR
ncbi:putative transcriptional regulator, TetR family [Nocardia nova SH22a]|uniref:Putative transcriptional regulator, TetR family n=1 Tax=Nocardia nova SH22a TaxID=1415166 RepID=W5TLG0_9NOCA|nr:TetR/AcrR family transcriptional regulator [Nocardia nova]AHH18066.1 putative transcriptional regulator, TetR family [Nocardia nova SH22a]